MNREIKFRVWNRIVGRMQIFQLEDLEKQKGKIQWQNIDIMQFTGLKDKNGKEIYEGDILELHYSNGKHPSQYEVVWDKESCGWNLIHAKREGDDWGVYTRNISLREDKKVIGNIYENPNLLNP